MSGFEVVGLVLAIIPLFISAAEHYREGSHFFKRLFEKERVLNRYVDDLNLHSTFLRLYLERLVGNSHLPASLQAKLVTEPGGDDWRDPTVVKELMRSIGDAHGPFMKVLENLTKILLDQVRPDDNLNFESTSSTQNLQALYIAYTHASITAKNQKSLLWDRIKFSWKEPTRNRILVDLKACNDNLLKLNEAVAGAQPYRKRQKSRRAHAAYELREEAQRLFHVLSKACGCKHLNPNEASLQMQTCGDRFDEIEEAHFHLLLSHPPQKSCRLSAKISRKWPSMSNKTKVRIQMPDDTSRPPPYTSNSMKKFGEICDAIREAHDHKLPLQIYIDNEERAWELDVARTGSDSQHFHQLLSLEEILSDIAPFSHKRWVAREKAILAVILAYSLLQLHESSWLPLEWNIKQISFLDDKIYHNSTKPPGYEIQLRNPYVKTRLMMVATDSLATISAPGVRRTSHRNPFLLTLGVLLLELHLNRTIEEDLKCPSNLDTRSVALNLLDNISDNSDLSFEYQEAIRFCLSPTPDPFSRSYSFKDPGFREQYYDQVIGMLECHLELKCLTDERLWGMTM